MDVTMLGPWFEPSERVSTPTPSRSWSGLWVSFLGHTALIGALIWAGKQWVPVTPPQTIEVMLMELPVQTTEQPQPTAVTAAQKTPIQNVPVQKPQPTVAQTKANSQPARPAPVVDHSNDLANEFNTGEKAPEKAAEKSQVKAQTPVVPPQNPALQPDSPREVSPARVDARYASTNPRPQYPSMARRLGQEGTVVLEVTVSEEGLAKSVRIQSSSGHELLDQAALNAISKWKFVPAKRGDAPVEQKLSTRWTYKLEE